MIPRNDRKALVATSAAGHDRPAWAERSSSSGWPALPSGQWLPLIAAMICTGYLGTIYGTRLLNRMPEEKFRTGVQAYPDPAGARHAAPRV